MKECNPNMKECDSTTANEEAKQKILDHARAFNEAIKIASKHRDEMYDLLSDLNLDPAYFEEANDDARGDWWWDFAASNAYDIEASAEFLEEQILEEERE